MVSVCRYVVIAAWSGSGILKLIAPSPLTILPGLELPYSAALVAAIAELGLSAAILCARGRWAILLSGALLSGAILISVLFPVRVCGCLGRLVNLSPSVRTIAYSGLLSLHVVVLRRPHNNQLQYESA
jgi:hypothetical protein